MDLETEQSIIKDDWILTDPVNQSFNETEIESLEYPYDLTFNADSVREISIYTVLFLIAATGNLPVFVSLVRNRHRKSRLNLMILHLTIADLIVTFVLIPLEIAWRITVKWMAGNEVCKIMLFMRAFGLYLSSMVLVCISLDRYYAILHPLKVNDAQRRSRIMLMFAWLISIICSVPQSVIFHVERHPNFPDFEQCVTFNFFPSKRHEAAYNTFCLLAVYGVPLIIIVYCYAKILWEISRRSRDTGDDLSGEQPTRGRFRLRRSAPSHIERARARTLRMTIIIVLAFFWCWTPYVVMAMWYQLDKTSASQVEGRIQSSLFMFAVSNSCVNPLVYGSFSTNFRLMMAKCCSFFKCSSGISRQGSRHTVTSAVTRAIPIEVAPVECEHTIASSCDHTHILAVVHSSTCPNRASRLLTRACTETNMAKCSRRLVENPRTCASFRNKPTPTPSTTTCIVHHHDND